MTQIDTPLAQRDYGSKITKVEPGGVEFIPLAERHGSPVSLLWTWASPNFEFATVFVGVIGTLYFGLSFAQAGLAILIGTALGSLTHAYLSSMGPITGLPQTVAGRSAFGFVGNWLPALLNSLMAGIGWFAVNSVSGALALASLTNLPNLLCLLVVVVAQVAIAFFGYNLVHVFERYAFPLLAIIFVVGAIVVFSKSHPGATSHGSFAGFTLMLSASFGYAAGWNPYASDYTRYLPPTTSRVATGLYAGLGVFVSCLVLELAGAAAVTATSFGDNPTESYTGIMSGLLGNLTLLAIALGAVSANVLNIYSGSMAFLALEIKLPSNIRRALVALTFGVIGFFVAWTGLSNAGEKYENFLLVIAYWVAPWLGVILTDRFLRRGTRSEGTMVSRSYVNWAGPAAFVLGLVVSVWLFSNQTQYVGLIAKHATSIGDLTPFVGFLLAAVIYAALFKPLADPVPPTPASVPAEA